MPPSPAAAFDALAALPESVLAALALTVAASLLVARTVARLTRPLRLARLGDYERARAAAEQLERSWLRIVPGVAVAARYTACSCLHLEGKHDASLDALAALDPARLDVEMRYAVLSLEAANHVLGGRDFRRALAALDGARALRSAPEDQLLAALATRALGDLETADALFAACSDRRAPDAEGSRLFRRAGLHATVFHALRGLYLVNAGRADEATADLRAAARAPHFSVYVELARALLPRPPGETDPRSTLAPQVLEDDE